MNPYNNNPFQTDATRDTRSEFAANTELRKMITRKEALATSRQWASNQKQGAAS